MARRIRAETAVAIAGVRGVQAAKLRADLLKLQGSDTDVYDFSAERGRVKSLLAAVEAGEAVYLRSTELASELLAVAGLRSRFDRSCRCFQLVGEQLIPADGTVTPVTSI